MQKELTDEKLILDKISGGDQQAFGSLFNFYKNKVYGYALSILQSEIQAEEIVQDVFIKLWIKRAQMSDIDNFGGFLRTLVKNDTLNALKKIANEQKQHQIIQLEHSDIDFGTEDSIQFKETKQILALAIEKLPPQQKLVYNLCNVEGLKQKDVAEKLNISTSTVKTHLRDAVKSIKFYLNNHDEMKIAPLLLFLLK